MIQIICSNYNLKNNFLGYKDIIVTTFSNYESFDMYDINIINLNSSEIWKCDNSQITKINIKDDLVPLKQSIKSSNTKILIAMPMNYTFYYNYSFYKNMFVNNKQLKSLNVEVTKFLKDYICDEILEYTYDKCKTTINGFIFDSDFYFNDIDKEKILLVSNNSNKVNTYISNNIVITTVNLFEFKTEENAYEKLVSFINNIYVNENQETLPSWIDDIIFFDDEVYINKIKHSQKEIKKLEKEIKENQLKLEKNNKIKGILYKTGNELNKEIIDILEDILKEHNNFNDVYEEDYKFINNNTTFIVETKGLNNEVTGQNVTDAFSHLTIYEDKLEKENRKEETKCLFFVASERKKMINERKKINSRQETIAKRNNTLIIDTPTFLNIYEDFLNKKISKEEIIQMFKEQFGVISYDKRESDTND